MPDSGIERLQDVDVIGGEIDDILARESQIEGEKGKLVFRFLKGLTGIDLWDCEGASFFVDGNMVTICNIPYDTNGSLGYNLGNRRINAGSIYDNRRRNYGWTFSVTLDYFKEVIKKEPGF